MGAHTPELVYICTPVHAVVSWHRKLPPASCLLHRLCLQAVDKFLHAKGKLDGNAAPPLNDIVEALHSLTTVRANLAAGLSSGESACVVLQHPVTDCVQDNATRHPPLTCHLQRFWLDLCGAQTTFARFRCTACHV